MLRPLVYGSVILSACLLPGLSIAAETATDPEALGSRDVAVVAVTRDDAAATRLTIEVPDIDIQRVGWVQPNTGFVGEAVSRVDAGLELTTPIEGWPELPMISRAVLVPPTAGVRLVVHDVESRLEENYTPFITPLQDGTADPSVTGEPSREYLDYDGFWPPEPVVMGEPAILRGHRIVRVSVFPMQFNRATGRMRFNDRVDFELVYEGEGRNIVRNPARPRPSLYIHNILRSLVVNPPETPSRDDLQSGSYLYIVPDVNGVDDAIEPLLEWRRRQGHRVVVEEVHNHASQNTIRDLIQNAYDEWEVPVEFAALVGDADGSISLSASGYGDYAYSRTDGNDPLPDVAVGRLSVSSVNELRRVVNKLVTYESDPYMDDTDWFLQGSVVAGSAKNGLGTVLVAKYVRKELLHIGFTEVRHWYHTENGNISGSQPFLTECLDWGISVLHYRAFASMNSLNQQVIRDLPNDEGRWPAVLAISCNTGDYVGENSCSEAFFRAEGGGIGAIGTATPGASTSPPFNNMMAGGVWKGIYKDKLYAFGWGLNSGKCELWKAYDGFNYSVFGATYMNFMEWNNLMGDPGTHIWTGVPRPITATYDDSLILGCNRFTVQVDDEEGIPEPDALVCLYKPDELHLTAYTDSGGLAEFYIPSDTLSEGELMVTVTKHNVYPHLASVTVEEEEYFIGASEWNIDDGEDGIPNPGEIIEIAVQLTNLGARVPEGPLTVEFESLSPWAEVTSEPVEVEDVPDVNESVQVPVTVEIDSSAPDGEAVLITVNTSDEETAWNSLVALEIESPRMAIFAIDIEGGELDRGEIREIEVEVANIGRKLIPRFEVTFRCESDVVSFVDSSAEYAALSHGCSATAANGRIFISTDLYAIPGMDVTLWMNVEAENGFRDTTSHVITLTDPVVTDPFGPDGYGYVCFDSDDDAWEMAPEYEWVEIDPDEDEDFRGENTGLRDTGDNQDKSTVVDLPFEFQYCGEVFDRLTICTNGWAAFGNQAELAAFRNRRIAQSLGPNAHLCAFWDNLTTGRIFTCYDEDGARFIVEWNDMRRLGGGDHETFELILYDIREHPTYSGDGIIVFQYKEARNGGTPARNDTPYCTIGISNLDDSDGLEYTYWNQYHPGAKRIEDEFAIKFTTATQFITGVLTGTVLDAYTGEPIPGVSIATSRGFRAVTDVNGVYKIDRILIGEGYIVTASDQGYNDSTWVGEEGEGFTIVEGETLTVDFGLLHPEFNIDTTWFDFRLPPEDSTYAEIRLSNDGNGILWFSSRFVYVLDQQVDLPEGEGRGSPRRADRDDPDEMWDPLLNWNVTDTTGDFRIMGIAFVRDHWVVSGGNNVEDDNYFYTFDRWGGYLGRSLQSVEGKYGIKNMVFHNGYIYCVSSDPYVILKVDPESYEEVGRILLQGVDDLHQLQSIAVGAEDHFFVTGITGRIYELELVDETRAVMVQTFNLTDPRTGENMRKYGLAWFRDDPDGYNLYIMCKMDNYNPDVSIFKMNPTSGEVRFLTDLGFFGEGFDGRGGICITPKWNNLVWAFAAVLDSSGPDWVGVFELGHNSSWIDYRPRVDTLYAGESQTISIDITAADLDTGSYGVIIEFTHNALLDEGLTMIPVDLWVGYDKGSGELLLPLEYSLEQNWPNPFNPTTGIGYSLKVSGLTRLRVFDLLGREVATLVDANRPAGRYRVAFDGSRLSAGVYFYRLESGDFTDVRKMVLLK